MITKGAGRLSSGGMLAGAMLLTSCSRAPSFDILGSFFPAWLLCLVLGLLLTVAARWLFLRAHVVIALPALTYPSLTALFTFVLWLAWFR
jgi:YtcA family